jgi:hypothetical protein
VSFNETPAEFVQRWTEAGAKDAWSVKDKKALLLKHYAADGYKVLKGTPLYPAQRRYFTACDSSFDPDFVRTARKLLLTDPVSCLGACYS